MNSFVNAVGNTTYTENGSLTLKSSLKSTVDLFFTIGALRGQTDRVLSKFRPAFQENPEVATRIALWARDVRGGAGERQTFRDILVELESNDFETLKRVIPRVPELGRWDDLLVLKTPEGRKLAFALIQEALNAGNGLCAKWMPRKGEDALELREFLGYTPKRYRKTLVSLTNVVETKMCANQWGDINYEHVPSVASSRYAKPFGKHDTERYVKYLESVQKGEAKINASAIFPYDVLRGMNEATVEAQWKSLPDFTSDKNILPMVDVSGSMGAPAGSKGNLSCMDVAVSLGLYLSEKNQGAFKNLALTFSEHPAFVQLTEPTVRQRQHKLMRSQWSMSTNLDAAFEGILAHAKRNNVPQKDMPEFVLVLSDMEFNAGGGWGGSSKTVAERTKDAFEAAGYSMPNIVWWNIQSRQDNVPVRFDEKGMALISGFSPSIVKSVLSASQIDPVSIMNEAIMKDRYEF